MKIGAVHKNWHRNRDFGTSLKNIGRERSYFLLISFTCTETDVEPANLVTTVE
jgi:hypothetical protein